MSINVLGCGEAGERVARIVSDSQKRSIAPSLGIGLRCVSQGTTRNELSSWRNKLANFAPQMRVAFSSMAWNTGSSSPGDQCPGAAAEAPLGLQFCRIR
jgi:hypothetical protein